MVQTNAPKDIASRIVWGLLGATLATAPPMMNWYDATLYDLPVGQQPRPAEYVWAGALLLGWIGGIAATAWETEHHYWNCFLKGVGVPGVIVAVAGLNQIVK